MKTICSTFKRLAIETWCRIDLGRTVGFQLKEETITDLLLLELKARHRNGILIKEFNKREEGINGADWEWWLYGYGKWLAFRIQAKVLDTKTGNFTHLHYPPSNSSQSQNDRLINDACKQNFHMRPLYCLYLNTDDRALFRKMTQRARVAELFGCSLLSAFEVRRLRSSRQKSLVSVESKMVPWHRLVCPTSASSRNMLVKIDRFAAEHFDQEDAENREFLLDNCPDYVKNAIDADTRVDIEPPNENLKGIVVFKLSDY
ncbi:MAG: hypothetical protein JNJ39_08115 [Blastocatellia bacterium]|nr:hypothetical protein [Blastocatellia bacterium]